MKKEEIQQNGALKKERQVLLICNDTVVCKKLESSIHEICEFETQTSEEGKKALEMIEESPWQYDVAVIYDDLKRKFSSREVFGEIKKNYPEMEVIFVIASIDKNIHNTIQEFAFRCFFLPFNYKEIAYAAKSAREQAKSRRERKLLEKLHELSIAINSSTESQEINNLACEAAVDILNADHSALVIFEKDLSMGEVIAEYPETNDFIGVKIKVKGIPAEEQLVYNRKIINVQDLATFAQFDEVQKTLTNLNIRSLLIVPVILNNKVIASFSLDMIKKNRIFYPDEIDVCKKLSSQVAVAIGKNHHEKERIVLNEFGSAISMAVSSDLNVEKIFGLIREYASALIDITNFYVAIFDKEINDYSCYYYFDENGKVIATETTNLSHHGLTDYVRRTKKAILVKADAIIKLTNEGEIKIIGNLPRIWLGAPLVGKSDVLGVMVVQNYENENAYDEHDLTILESIASQAAVAIENTRLIKDDRRKIGNLEIAENIVHTINDKLNIGELFKKMVAQITKKLKCSHCTLFFPKKMGGKMALVPNNTYGIDTARIMSRYFKLGEGLVGWVFQKGETILLPDARKDPRYFMARQRKNLPRSMLVAPVKVGNRTIGVISADQDKYGWFSESDLELVETIVWQVGVAIERALLLNQLKEMNTQINSLEDENDFFSYLNFFAYQNMKDELYNNYYDHFVAFLDGEKVAHNANKDDLIREVYSSYGRTDIFITKITEKQKIIKLKDIGHLTNKTSIMKENTRMKLEKMFEYKSINKVIKDVLNDTEYEAAKKSATVIWKGDKSHDQKHGYFDEILVKQALKNLISNSLRWIPVEGKISITSLQKGDYISILVKDNGRGIDPGIEKHIFDPYFTTSQEGYGIGLFFVRNVVKMHAGEIKLVSSKNPTIFEIKIPSKLGKVGTS